MRPLISRAKSFLARPMLMQIDSHKEHFDDYNLKNILHK